MPEQHNIEYKQSWHDDYLKWVCGFANAQGGTIYIGKDDNGQIVHVPDFKSLMEIIPQKIKDQLGIMIEVNLHQEAGNYFIEIITPPYSIHISLRGQYYYRTGSTKMELTGTNLTEFLLKKSGKLGMMSLNLVLQHLISMALVLINLLAMPLKVAVYQIFLN